jgi:autotransporter translocation and assembly factor TamB
MSQQPSQQPSQPDTQASTHKPVAKKKKSRLKRIVLWMLSPFALLLLLIVLLVTGYWYVTATSSGTARLIGFASDTLPALEIEGVKGALRDNLDIDRIFWENDGIEIEVSDSRLKASTFPPRITIDTLAAKLITVNLPLNE